MYKSIRPTALLKHFTRTKVTGRSVNLYDEGTKVTVLPNGIRVATEYQPSPLSCMSLFIEAGSRFETAWNNGITHFLEHMAYKGFCGMNKCELDRSLLLMGARMTAQTTRDIQKFTCTFPSEYVACILDKLAAVVTNLNLDQCEIEAEKYNICLEMVDEEKDSRAVTFDYLHETAFQGTPLAQRVIGPTRNVRRFDREFAVNFLCQHYQPYKICLSTSGNVKHEDIVCFANRRLGHLYGDACYESDEGPCRFTGSSVVYRDDSMPFAHVAIAFEAPGYTSPDYLINLVANRVMGKWHKSQGGGLNNASPLAQAASCDNICESFEPFYIAYRDIGLWGIYFVAKTVDLEYMVANIQLQWMHLCTTFQYTDLERAINLVKLEMARDVTGVINSCNDIGTQLLYTCTRKSLQDKFYNLSQIKFDEVRQCADKLLYDRCPVVAAVGPTEALPDYNRIRSGQYWLRL